MGLTKTFSNSGRKIDRSRDTAADLLSRTATRVRHGSKRASQVVERGGSGVASSLQGAAERVGRDEHAGIGSYARRHPGRLLLIFGLLAGGIAVFLIRRAPAYADDGANEDF